MNPIYGHPLNQTVITYQEILDNLSDKIITKIVFISIIFLCYALWNILILRDVPLLKIEENLKKNVTGLLDYLCLIISMYFIVLYLLYLI